MAPKFGLLPDLFLAKVKVDMDQFESMAKTPPN